MSEQDINRDVNINNAKQSLRSFSHDMEHSQLKQTKSMSYTTKTI
jgi:hypothetical protein